MRIRTDPRYYILDDNNRTIEVDSLTWAHWLELNFNRRSIGWTGNDYKHVSTVFIGIDMNFDADGPPLTFETMLFINGSSEDMARYSTYDAAKTGHDRFVAKYISERGSSCSHSERSEE